MILKAEFLAQSLPSHDPSEIILIFLLAAQKNIFSSSIMLNTVVEYCMFLCGSVVEHCVSNGKGCGFDSQGTQVLMKNV